MEVKTLSRRNNSRQNWSRWTRHKPGAGEITWGFRDWSSNNWSLTVVSLEFNVKLPLSVAKWWWNIHLMWSESNSWYCVSFCAYRKHRKLQRKVAFIQFDTNSTDQHVKGCILTSYKKRTRCFNHRLQAKALNLVSSPDPTLSQGEMVWWTKSNFIT